MPPKKTAQASPKAGGGILRSGRFAKAASADVVAMAKSPRSRARTRTPAPTPRSRRARRVEAEAEASESISESSSSSEESWGPPPKRGSIRPPRGPPPPTAVNDPRAATAAAPATLDASGHAPLPPKAAAPLATTTTSSPRPPSPSGPPPPSPSGAPQVSTGYPQDLILTLQGAWQLRLTQVTPLSICTPPLPIAPLPAAKAMAAATTKAPPPVATGAFGLRAPPRPVLPDSSALSSLLPPTALVPHWLYSIRAGDRITGYHHAGPRMSFLPLTVDMTTYGNVSAGPSPRPLLPDRYRKSARFNSYRSRALTQALHYESWTPPALWARLEESSPAGSLALSRGLNCESASTGQTTSWPPHQGRFVRLFEAHPPYLAGTPGVILPDDIRGTPLSPAHAPVEGQTTCKVMLIPGIEVHVCTSPQVIPTPPTFFSGIVQERLARLHRWMVTPPPPSRFARPPVALAPTQIDGLEDTACRGVRPVVQVNSDSDADDGDAVILIPGPGGQGETAVDCTTPCQDGRLEKALRRVRPPSEMDHQETPDTESDTVDTVEALGTGDDLPPPSPEHILNADPAASDLLLCTSGTITPPRIQPSSEANLVEITQVRASSPEPLITCQPLPAEGPSTLKRRRRQLPQLEAEARAQVDHQVELRIAGPSQSLFSPRASPLTSKNQSQMGRPAGRRSTSSSKDDSSSYQSGTSHSREPRRFTDSGVTVLGIHPWTVVYLHLVGSKARAHRTPAVPDLAIFEALLAEFQEADIDLCGSHSPSDLTVLSVRASPNGPSLISKATVEEVNSYVLQQATVVFPAVRNQGMWQASRYWRHGLGKLKGPGSMIKFLVDCLKTFFQDLYAPEAPTAAIVACADLLAPWLSDKVGSATQYYHDNCDLSVSRKVRAVYWPDAVQGRRCIVSSAIVTKCCVILVPSIRLQAEVVPIELRVQLLEFYRGLLMRRLARATSAEWVRRALTAFADDFHIGQVVYSNRDLLLSIERLGHVLQLLIDARMKVNIDKSVILLSVNHSYARRWRRREILSDKEGPRLRISTPTAGTFKLPIVATHKYLGAIISYQEDCTQLTVAYRLRQTWATWTRLRPALTSASAPALPLRLRLWQACVPPTALYALDSLPLQQQHLAVLEAPAADLAYPGMQDQRELGLFQNFMTPPAGMDMAQPKRRRGEEPDAQPALFLSHSSGSQASASTLAFTTTSSEPKGKGKGKQPKGKGRGKGGKSRPAAQQSWNDQWSPDQSWSSGHSWTSSADLTGQMARLLLRHEQQLQSIQQDCKLHLYLRSGKESFLPNLCEIAKEWSRLRRDKPGNINSPLRTLLLRATLQEMETRIKLTLSKEKQTAIDMQWYKEEEGWTYMQWNAQKGPDLRLMRNMCWTMLLGNWERPDQQHDMHEFLLHLMPRARLEAFSGLWQTRRLEDTGIVICASSSALLPVTVDLPSEARGLQHCVQEWFARHYRTAFEGTMPRILCLHLSRYRRDARGILSKDDQALPDWSEVLRIPQFATTHDLQKHWRPYQVCAMALHYGPTLHQGHYRCLTRWGQNPVRVWLHDDNRAAAPLSLSDSVELSRKAYIVWAVRMD
ncbi:unnamed protein product [Symbiodinium sp. CCMP2592]|nr:unnamed protein product [Symbiodinium sp. CCMP2592]